jgi:hypothetical protein
MTGAAKANTAQQLKLFDEAFEEYGGGEVESGDWFEAFKNLRKLISDTPSSTGKKVVFIDELPWLATPRSDFLMALEHFWNSWGSAHPDLLLIVCGSATSWIIDNIINSHGGLHNRVTRQLLLKPFSLGETDAYLQENGITMTRYQIIETYMVLGGIPYYLEYLKDGLSPAQNIDSMFFNQAAPLRYEFDNLYASLFRQPQNHLRIIDALYDKKIGLTRNELVKAADIKSGATLTKTLAELEQCGFIRHYRDFTSKKNGYYYQLIDFFTFFYLKFVRGNESQDASFWQDASQKAGYNAWAGLAFERVCQAHVAQLKQRLGISGVKTETSAWRSKTGEPKAQIDLIISRADEVVDLCEMKFARSEYTLGAADAEDLRRRRERFREDTGTKKALHNVLVTTYGLSDASYRSAIQQLITMDDLFAI